MEWVLAIIIYCKTADARLRLHAPMNAFWRIRVLRVEVVIGAKPISDLIQFFASLIIFLQTDHPIMLKMGLGVKIIESRGSNYNIINFLLKFPF